MNREIDPREIQYGTLPEQYRDQMRAYIERGERPGSFIQHVLDGDLFGAFNLSGNLPEEPGSDLITVTGWVSGQCPVKAYGNIGAVEVWIASRGLTGLEAKRRQQEREAQEYKDWVQDIGGAQNASTFSSVIQGLFGRKA